MAPPRLPAAAVERLIPILASIPAVAAQGAAGRRAVLEQVRVDAYRLTGLDARKPPEAFARDLLGDAANLVPAYEGARQGWTALGEILALLLDAPSVAATDQEWIAALVVRYHLIPWDRAEADVPPALRGRLAAVPAQSPAYYEGGMFPPAMERGFQYDALAQAVAAGAWPQVQALVESLQGRMAVPEVAAAMPAELAARGLDLPALLARAQAESADPAQPMSETTATETAGSVSTDPPPAAADPTQAGRQARKSATISTQVLGRHAQRVAVVVVTADSRRALSGGSEGTLTLWDLDSGQALRTLTSPIHPAVGMALPNQALALLPGGGQAVSGAVGGTLTVWDLATGAALRTLPGPWRAVQAICIMPGGQEALVACEDDEFTLRDLATGGILRTYSGPRSVIHALALTADAQQVLTASHDRMVRLWDLATGRVVRTFSGHTSVVSAVTLTPDGTQVLTGSLDDTVRLWDLASGALLGTYVAPRGAVNAIAVSPNGAYLLAASYDRPVIWNRVRGTRPRRRILRAASASLSALALTPDGCTLVGGGYDGTVRLWRLPPSLLGE